jgi:hypothetical protein
LTCSWVIPGRMGRPSRLAPCPLGFVLAISDEPRTPKLRRGLGVEFRRSS